MSLVGDFWKEQREESKKKKQLRKQNKKQKLTGEQKAYKIFGVFFALFLIFGSFFYTCRGTGDVGDVSIISLMGIDDEIIELLNKDVDTNLLLPNGRIGSTDYANLQEILSNSGIDLYTDGEYDEEKISNVTLSADCTLIGKNIGAFVNTYSTFEINYMTIYDVEMYELDGDIFCKSVALFNLSSLYNDNSLGNIFVTNVSIYDILDGTISSIANVGRINTLNDKENDKVIETLNRNILYDFNNCVNLAIANNISSFSTILGCQLCLETNGITFKKVS